MPNLVNDFEVRKETLRALGGNPDGLANIFEVDKEILKLISEGGSGIDWDTIKQNLAEDGVESIKFIMGNEQVILTAEEVKTLLNQLVIPEGKYMTITADKSNTGETIISPTVTGNLPNLNLQYRINNGDWMDFIVGTTADIHVVFGDFVQFKGVNESGLSMDYDNFLNFSISGNPVHLSGNVMSLIDGVGETTVIPNILCFYKMFSQSNVKTVSLDFLPATSLQEECYRDLFSGCTSLTKAPELPATNLVGYCYYSMFRSCTSLVKAPALPATNLTESCYSYMFFGCTALTTAPELPATTLANHCYDTMFSNCTSLVKAPELPATTLANYCYNAMFFYCPSLTTTPLLPAKVLVESCYQDMFKYCNYLNYVKCLATDITATNALTEWLLGIYSSGTFEKPDGVTYTTGASGIPEGWTVKEIYEYIEAPKDGNQYARQDGDWVEVSKVKTTNNNTLQFWNGTQQEYDAIATKDANTLYIIK